MLRLPASKLIAMFYSQLIDDGEFFLLEKQLFCACWSLPLKVVSLIWGILLLLKMLIDAGKCCNFGIAWHGSIAASIHAEHCLLWPFPLAVKAYLLLTQNSCKSAWYFALSSYNCRYSKRSWRRWMVFAKNWKVISRACLTWPYYPTWEQGLHLCPLLVIFLSCELTLFCAYCDISVWTMCMNCGLVSGPYHMDLFLWL